MKTQVLCIDNVKCIRLLCLKPPELSLDINNRNNQKCPKNLNNYVINHKIEVIFACFEENPAQTRTFSNTPFNTRGNHFLINET